jgi:hypothetical protein
MTEPNFSRFINFGSIAGKSERNRLAKTLHERLKDGEGNAVFTNTDTGNFADALETILCFSETMRDLCAKDASLAEQVSQETLDFINKTKRQFAKIENPFENEQGLLSRFEQIEENDFPGAWEAVFTFLQETYEKQGIDTDFYVEEFKKSLSPVQKESSEKSDKDKKKKTPPLCKYKRAFYREMGRLAYTKTDKAGA